MAAAEKIGAESQFVPFGNGQENREGLSKMREPFPAHQISKLPKGTKDQNKCPYEQKRHCNICGGFHHPKITHLDYVGHAALTDRLLEADPNWSWSPLAFDDQGLPRFDASGGLWIRLTVCGVTRLGYGHAAAKDNADPGSREKEVIGDALRNAGMRFGAALDLWHKGDLHLDEDETDTRKSEPPPSMAQNDVDPAAEILARFGMCQTLEEVAALGNEIRKDWGRWKNIKGFADQMVKARQKANERLKPTRQPGEDDE